MGQIKQVTNESYELIFDSEISSDIITIKISDVVTISDFFLDTGDGYKPFKPLLIHLLNYPSAGLETAANLPMNLPVGTYTLKFYGEPFIGTALYIKGLNLYHIDSVTIGNDVLLANPPTDTSELIHRDGSVAFTNDQSLGTHKVIHLADGIESDDAAAFGQISSAITATLPEWFGDHTDGDVAFDGTQGTVSGVFTKNDSTHYTILREVHFGTVQINSGIYVRCAYRFFYDHLINNGFLHNNGNDGTAGSDGMNSSTTASGLGGSKGIGGAAAGAGYFLDDSGAGMDGMDGENNDGSGSMVPFNGNAASPSTMSNILGVIGYQGAPGGTRGSGSRGGGGGPATGGVASFINSIPASAGSLQNLINAYLGRLLGITGVISFNLHGKNGGPASGGGGCSGSVYGAGYGAGGGGSAGNGSDAAPIAVIGRKRTGAGKIQSNGGNGKDGGKGGNGLKVSNFNSGNGGGGGGSHAGHGSILIDICHDLTDWTGSVEALGGTKGHGGQPGTYPGPDGASATAGGDGQDGYTGLVIAFKV
jgi:hypothetical protein